MPDLELLLNQLSEVTKETNLVIGDSYKLKSEIQRLTQVNQKVNQVYNGFQEALNDEQFNKGFLSFLPWVGTVASFFIPGGFLAESIVSGGGIMLANKLVDPDKETSLADILEHTGELIGWVDGLKEIAEDLLNNTDFLNKVTNRSVSITQQFNQLDKQLRLNLEVDNLSKLKQQINQIKEAQEKLRELQDLTDKIIDNIEKNVEVIDRIKILILYFGQSEFALEWIDDEQGLIISYDDDQIISIGQIFEHCTTLRGKLEQLESKAHNFRVQAEQLLKKQPKKVSHKQDNYVLNQQNYSVHLDQIPNNTHKKNWLKILLIGSALTTSGYLGYVNIDKINTAIPMSNSIPFLNQDASNLETAQKLAMEASLIVQKPPHPLSVWQQSQTKWQNAIELLEKIPNNSSLSAKVNQKLTNYRQSYQLISQRIKTEEKALTDFQNAQNLALEATMLTQNKPSDISIWKQSQTKWKEAITLLQNIPQGTFVEKQAKDKLKTYQLNYQMLTNHINKY
jgi:hypothetical protein